jgi:cell division protein FtsW
MSAVGLDLRNGVPQSRRRTATRRKAHDDYVPAPVDGLLLFAVLALLTLGIVMVGSASMAIADRDLGNSFYYLIRQGVFVAIGLALAMLVVRIPLTWWERSGPVLFIASMLLLAFILLPGIGREVNGATRWLRLGLFNLQPSELMKLSVIVYLAGYLVRRGEEVRSHVLGFLKPMMLLIVVALLLLMEPDLGASVVIFATALGMMFLGGVRLWQFLILIGLVGAAGLLLVVTSPYRLERVTAFLNPWADPFNSGFQLTQSLIAFGRGEWFGVGLGGGIQKLFYLPEAHTDFVFAVLAEELGLVGGIAVVALFLVVIWRAFAIAARAQYYGQHFAAFLAHGIVLWIALQAFINLGVNMGLLPTKGLTLPLMSYGGSSMLAMCVAIALLLRVDIETRLAQGESTSLPHGGGR